MSQKKLKTENNWHYLCHKSELKKENSYVNISFKGKEIFALYEDGSINVFENMCMHRGSKLVEGKNGVWNKKCPYHGVCYENGFPVNVEEKGLRRSKDRIRLNKYHASEVGDFIFFSENDDENNKIADFLGKETFEHLESISKIIDEPISDTQYYYDCRWEVAIENALEPLHLEDIHPETLDTLDLGKSENEEYDNSVIFNHAIKNQNMVSGLKKMQKLFSNKFNEKYHSTYVFPYFFISSTFGFSFSIQTFFPSNEKFKTHFRSRVYSSKAVNDSKKKILKNFFDSTIKINKQIFEEDADICSKIVKTDKHFIGPLADTEEKIIWFRKRLRLSN